MDDLSTLLERVRQALPEDRPAYLVGGAVRDQLLGRPSHDLDFALPGEAVLKAARQAANALGGAYYPLDEGRETARVILEDEQGERTVLDFAALRGPDLESDLRLRDFTINAIAIDLADPNQLIDPLGGAADLRAKLLRACSPETFIHDPLRILRAVRQAIGLGFRILPETVQLMRPAAPLLSKPSAERVRDEVFRMLGGPQPVAALRSLEVIGALQYVFPELVSLKGITQSPPHIADVFEHTLDAAQRMGQVLDTLRLEHDPEAAANWAIGFISVELGRYRQQLSEHLADRLNPDRSLRALLILAALYHDIGKPATRQVEAGGRVRYLEHEQVGAQTAVRRAEALRLSSAEVERLKKIIQMHMRPLLLAQQDSAPTRRAIYRFFRNAGPAGVDACLFSLADTLATYGPGLPNEVWARQLETVRLLLEAWWEHPQEQVSPPALVNGHDLMQAFDLQPGPHLKELLEAIREAQAVGQVHTREDALALARTELGR